MQRTVPPHTGEIGAAGWTIVELWPEPPKPDIPDYLPAEVVKPLLSAERNFPEPGMEEAAAGSYGRALDVGTKLIAQQEPDAAAYSKLMLFARISKLAAANRIAPDLAEWAHHIRSVRNDALHDVGSIDREELKAVRGLTEMVLRYLFTLPGMLAERRAAAAAGLTEPLAEQKDVDS